MPHNPDRENRPDLGREHPWGDRGQIIFFITFLIVWGMDSFIIPTSTFLALLIPLWLSLPLAGILIVIAIRFIQNSQKVVFGEVREPPRVIDTGVFARVRHPMYLGSLLFFLGLAVATWSLFSFTVWAVMFLFFDRIATFEERELEQIFGTAYREYKLRVPKWVPRLRIK